MNDSEWANNLLQDDRFRKVFEDLRQIQLNRIINSSERDLEEREAAYSKLTAVQDVYNHIVSMADQRKINEKRWKIF